MSHIFVDKKRRRLTVKEFDELSRNPGYAIIREFENERLYVKVCWNGIVHNSRSVPAEHWKIFELAVLNIITTDGEGNPLPQPKRVRDVDLSQRFASESEAINAFEMVLVKYGACKGQIVEPSGEGGRAQVVGFEEVGNKLLPPSPDRPIMTDTKELSAEFGSW